MATPGDLAPPPARAHILCLAGPGDLAAAAWEALRGRFAGSHVVELLREPADVSAVIRTLRRTGRPDVDELEVIVAEAAGADSEQAMRLRAHWPGARWALLEDRGQADPRAPVGQGGEVAPRGLSPEAAAALAAEVESAIESYRQQRRADRHAALASMELLRALSPERIAWIALRMELRRYEAGEVVVTAGEPGDGVYFIRSGEVKVLDADTGDSDRIIARRGRGEHFGELSLTTGEPRSNSVVADHDSDIFFLAKEHYDALMGTEPNLGVHLNRVLSSRLARAHRRHRQTPRVIACYRVLPDAVGVGTMRALAAAIAAEAERTAVLLELEVTHPSGSADPLESALRRLEASSTAVREDAVELAPGLWRLAAQRPATLQQLRRPQLLPALLDALAQAFHFVLVALGPRTPPDVCIRVAKQCDVLLVHVGQEPGLAQQARDFLALLDRDCPSAEPKILVAAEPAPGADAAGASDAGLGRRVDHRLPSHTGGDAAAQAYRLAARRLLGITVGLALGGGGARGAAHLGVLEVLDGAGVPIDLIGGTSAGSMVGGGIAMGRTVADAVDCWRRETVVSPIRRYTLSKAAIFSDRALEALLKRLYGDLRIEHLPIPFFAVATDLNRAVATPIDHGPLWLAVRASCALPGGVAPVRIGDSYFVDGGVANNVPADLARSRGARFVIAVDIGRERGFNERSRHQGPVARTARRIPWLREFLDAPGILQVLARAMEVQSAQTVSARAWSWNVCVRPDVSGFGLLEVGTTDALMERGREAALRILPDIKAGLRALLDEL